MSSLPLLHRRPPAVDPSLPAAAEPRSVLSPAPRAAWAARADADPQGLVTQTPAWTDAVCAVTGARDASRLYDFGGGRTFVLPMVRRGPGAAFRSSLPPAWGFGGLVGGTPRVEEVRAVLRDLAAHPGLRVRVRPNPLQHELWAAARPRGVIALERRAHAIDLLAGFDGVWEQGFSKRARNHVRRAERAGLGVELDTEGRLAGEFHALFLRSVDRWAERQHEPRVLARWRALRRDPPEKLTALMDHLRGAGRIWLARLDGRPAAAILVLQGTNAHYTRGVMDVELAGPTRANYLLHRHAIEDACRSGCAVYHMGETGSSRSLGQFKEAVGARPHPYAEYLAEALPLTSADRTLRSAVKRVVGFRDVA